jgi:hypothetical protein
VYRRAEVAIGPSAPHLASDWRKGLSAKHSPLRLSCTLPRAPPQHAFIFQDFKRKIVAAVVICVARVVADLV